MCSTVIIRRSDIPITAIRDERRWGLFKQQRSNFLSNSQECMQYDWLCFSPLKGTWIILLGPMDIPVSKLANFNYTGFVLHNYCKKARVEVDANFVENFMQEEWCANLSIDKLNSYHFC